MKKLLLIITMFLTVGVTALRAQDDEDGKQNAGGRVEALKIAYLTKKLNLSTEEAQKFWPIYNKYTEEIRKVRIEARANKDKEIDTEEKVLGIRKKYNGEFVKAGLAELELWCGQVNEVKMSTFVGFITK